ncbi:MAG: hypothetical protein HY275_08400 [Gemmatimonadetes bacterium]|nr:hypothetical protein [Gemmatimonadota bacterium]
MNCSGCHYPVVPRLNATGLAFKWAGYRMPSEIGEKAEVRKIEEYLAAQAIAQHNYAKTSGQPTEVNAISVPSASLYVGGALGSNYGAFLQFERGTEGSIDLVAQFAGAWGDESRFVGVRVGTGHALAGGMVAGFDRATGILQPLAISSPVTGAVPFAYGGDATELEASIVFDGRSRTSIQLLNGLASPTSPAGSATTQFVGGYVYGRDSKLPVGGGAPFASSRLIGTGAWASALYAFPVSLASVYGRYEQLDPDHDVSNAGLRRYVLGGILPLNGPPYLRLGIELFLDTPLAPGAPKRQGISTQLQFNF